MHKWIKCDFAESEYHTTQILTDHGCFMYYLHRMGKRDNGQCMYCNDVDTAEHTLFHCEKWKGVREDTERDIGDRLNKDNMIEKMTETKGNWISIHKMIKKIMKTKIKDSKME